MGLLDELEKEGVWQEYFTYKENQIGKQHYLKFLEGYITEKKYLPVLAAIREGKDFPLPKKKIINKLYTGKKRIVYTYPQPENQVLKTLTYLLLRKYDGLFSQNLYSFRPAHGAKEAIRKLAGTKNVSRMYTYKADISNYFNSVDLELFLPELSEALADDLKLLAFLKSLLSEPLVRSGSGLAIEEKGIMAGTPLACFYANLFLKDLDWYFEEKGILYARYSDDIIVFAETKEELDAYVDHIREHLEKKHLAMNPDKEFVTVPGEQWTFLGFAYQEGVLDIAPASVDKLKGKMRRKREALRRWQQRKELTGDKAAKAFIKVFNRKLFEAAEENDLTWSRWYFPVINTTDSLKAIDLYAQDCIRYLVSGKHTKARFNVRYEDMKALGYRSLVHEYYTETEKRSM